MNNNHSSIILNHLYSWLLKKAILMALWTKEGLCVKSSLLEQSLPRLVRHPCGGTPSRLISLYSLWLFSLFLRAFCFLLFRPTVKPFNRQTVNIRAFLWLKNPRNLRNPWLMNYLPAYKAPFSPPYSLLLTPYSLLLTPYFLLLTPYSLFLRAFGPFTSVEKPLQIFSLIMQNEPNFRKSQMNVNKVLIKEYEKKDTWLPGKNEPKTNPIKANSNPIKANKMPKQTQYGPNQTQCLSAISVAGQRQNYKQPPILQLIMRTWCYKSTAMFTKYNVSRNCFSIKSLHPIKKHLQIQSVDFLQHRLLTHIRVVFRKVETKLKDYAKG
ncbi:MAG: hypothetical protein FVQ85_00025 [Planctomycetes bacterium]|nr:hypothetical protein [Planctomycetota bacterium]